MRYLGIFGLEFENNVVIFEISTLENDKNGCLTHTVNFGIRSASSEGPGPGPDPLYKVCLFCFTQYVFSQNFVKLAEAYL